MLKITTDRPKSQLTSNKTFIFRFKENNFGKLWFKATMEIVIHEKK